MAGYPAVAGGTPAEGVSDVSGFPAVDGSPAVSGGLAVHESQLFLVSLLLLAWRGVLVVALCSTVDGFFTVAAALL
jgi:hypothetical protein